MGGLDNLLLFLLFGGGGGTGGADSEVHGDRAASGAARYSCLLCCYARGTACPVLRPACNCTRQRQATAVCGSEIVRAIVPDTSDGTEILACGCTRHRQAAAL